VPAAARALAPFATRLTGLDDVEDTVVVGCSGGADSLALLALVRDAGYDACAVHVDHGLRPGALDASIVEAASARFGAAFRAVRIKVAPGGNLEARARDARYAALERVRVEIGAEVIAVGHTRDDQAETVLLNFLRGSGSAGLAGMASRRGMIRRPLLGLRRAETREICARLGLAPIHDPMNDDLHYRRVWLRREVIPFLERNARRDLVEVLARQAEALRSDDELLDELAHPLEGSPDALDAAELAAAPLALARRAVRQWVGMPAPSFEQTDSVLAVARGELRAVELSRGRRVERSGGQLHVVSALIEPPAVATFVVPGRVTFGCFTIAAWIEHAPPVAWPDGRHTAVFDADRLGDAVTIEAFRPGTRFRPLGRSGTKLVADGLREAGIAASDRRDRPIVMSAAREVCWVVGYRIDEHVKVTARTRRFLWMSVESIA
jgi:tRNA(Ile)-lysidine synthase